MTKYKMDLHVHTPASKCYKDEKKDESYYGILREAVQKKVSLIAITDHNTIAGYKHFFELKDKLLNEKKILSEFQDETPSIKERINSIDDILSLYSKVWILPGVEITLNPGVHIIVIASKDNVEDLSIILDQVGYNEDMRGSDSEFLPSFDVHNFLNLPILQDKIVFAPHIDSDKGIYNVLPGLYRAAVFKSDIICAVSCNSSTQLEKIQKLIKYDPNYRRNYIWAYLNASDAHTINDVGSRTSYVKLERKTFEDLKNALMNSTEFVSDIEHQGIEMFIKSLIKRQRVIMVSDDKIIKDEFDEILCAALNSEYRCVLLGVGKDARLNGTSFSEDDVEKIVKKASKNIVNFNDNSVGFISEKMGNGKSVHVVLLRNLATELCYVKSTDEVYIYSKEKRKAKISEIEKIVQNKLLAGIEKFQAKNDNTISVIQENLSTVQYPIEKYKLLKSLEAGKRFLADLVDFKHIEVKNNPNIWDEFTVGNATGTVFMAKNEEIVLDFAVLRFSCPQSKESFDKDILNNMFELDDSYIVITNRGGTYLAEINPEEKNTFYVDSDADYICIKLSDESQISKYALIAWLKSKAFLWYITRISGSTKLYNPMVYNSIIIPGIRCLNVGGEIENISKKIIHEEKKFLEKKDMIENKNLINPENEEEYIREINDLANSHNNTVNGMFNQVDEIIFNELKINERQKEIINNDLIAYDLAIEDSIEDEQECR